MTTLDEAVALARGESGLAVISTLRADGTIQASLVNCGVLPHPESGTPVLAFVTYGRVKLANLRARPALAATFRELRLPRDADCPGCGAQARFMGYEDLEQHCSAH